MPPPSIESGSATVYELFRHWADKSPQRPAIQPQGSSAFTFRSLQQQITIGSEMLKSLGIGRNDRVAVALPERTDMALVCLMVCVRGVCVPLNPDYTRDEFERYLSATDSQLLVAEPGTTHPSREAAESLGIPVVGFKCSADSSESGFESVDAPPQAKVAEPSEFAQADDTAVVLLTSGSTAEPKRVPLTHRNIMDSARNVVASLELTDQDCALNTMPLFHIGGLVDLLIAPLSVGGSAVIGRDVSSKTALDCLTRYQPTWYQGVPTMLQDLVTRAQSSEANPKAILRFIRSVSAPLDNGIKRDVESCFHAPVVEIYGMTETTGVITSNPLDVRLQKPGSVGRCVGPDVAIVDEAGNHARANQTGEVIVRGSTVMGGYEGPPQTNDGVFIGAWLRTGDEGYLDDGGYLFLSGRVKEIINRGGEKISPREIDAVAMSHPAVSEAAAFPQVHLSLGEEVAIAVVTKPNATWNESEFTDFLSSKLAYFKVPRKVERVTHLPKTPSGKLRRHALAETYGGVIKRVEGADFVAPHSPLSMQLATTWESALGVSPVGLHDNFFDLGGDSLKAATFVSELQQTLQQPIQVFALYDHPTVAEFECYLKQHVVAESTDSSLQSAASPSQAIYTSVAAYMSGWQGQRRTPDSLIVGRNTLGSRSPLFWCTQSYGEFAQLAKHLSDDQPIYGLRSLYQTPDKSADANGMIAARYVDEILAIQPSGPYIVGGFCEGGKVAFEIARQLRAQHLGVALLCLQDQFVPQSYDGRVALFFCPSGKHSPYQHFYQPQCGWSKFYTGGMNVHVSDGSHDEYYVEPHVITFARQLTEEMDVALATPLNNSAQMPRLQILSDDAYQANIVASVPAHLKPRALHTVVVTVTNISPQAWQPTDESGLILGCRWRNRSGALRSPLASHCVIEETVAPGATVSFDLVVRVPAKPAFRVLEIDMIDDGVAWFSDTGSHAARFNVNILPGAAVLNRLWNSKPEGVRHV